MRWRGLAACSGGALAIAGVALACRQLVGIGDAPPQGATSTGDGSTGGDAAPTVCGLPIAGACADCVNAWCCAAAVACSGDPACAAITGCYEQCNGDPSCLTSCLYDSPQQTQSDKYPPLRACQTAHCEAPCNLNCGDVGYIYSPPEAGAACQSCLVVNACEAGRTCAATEACEAYGQCLVYCRGRVDCATNCTVGNDAGVALGSDLGKAVSGVCSEPCETGNNWECVGHLSPPAPQVTSTLVSLQFVDPGSQAPVAGAQVSICNAEGCGATVDTTNAAGEVTVTVPIPQQSLGPTGYLQITSGQDGGFLPEFFYWGSPLSAPTLTLPTPLLLFTPSELAVLELEGQITQDSTTHGMILAAVIDCIVEPSPNVVFDVSPSDSSTKAVYLAGGTTPNPAMTQTDRSGLVAIANVPAADAVTVTASFAGHPVGHVAVRVQPGTLTLVLVPPSPP
jgi:hypothetical protein